MITDEEYSTKTTDEKRADELISAEQISESRVEYRESCGCTGGGHGYLMIIVAILFVLYAVATVLI